MTDGGSQLISGRRALLVSGTYPPDAGGPSSFVPQLREYLLDNGWQVQVVAISESLDSQSAGVDIVLRGNSAVSRRTHLIRRLVPAVLDADVVFANTLLTEVGTASRAARKPWVAKVVGEPIWERASNRGETSLDLLEFHQQRLGFTERVERWTWIQSLSSAASVIVPGPHLQALLVDLGVSSRITVVPNGVAAVGAWTLGTPSRDFDVVCVCRLVSLKRVQVLVESAARVGFNLLVVGDGPEEQSLRCRAAHDTKTGQVTFKGRVPAELVQELLAQSRVFALMSSHEGLSFALLEAKAAGLPVVASDVPGNRLVVRDGVDGFLVDPMSPSAVDGALSALLEKPALARRFGVAGRLDVMERFSLEQALKVTSANLAAAVESGRYGHRAN